MSKKLPKKDELEAERIAGELVKLHKVDPLTPKEVRKLAIACKLFGARLEADPIRFQFQKHDILENTNDPSKRNLTQP